MEAEAREAEALEVQRALKAQRIREARDAGEDAGTARGGRETFVDRRSDGRGFGVKGGHSGSSPMGEAGGRPSGPRGSPRVSRDRH